MARARLSPHQQRVVAAILELSRHHRWDWWTRDEIGLVVGAGGYHQTLQMRTMTALKVAGYIQTERSSWDNGVRDVCKCDCATHRWGLTFGGREDAKLLKIHWPEQARERIKHCFPPTHFEPLLDEDDAQRRFRERFEDDDDDDDDDGDDPAPKPTPGLSPAGVA